MGEVVFVTQTAYVGGGMEHWLCALISGLKAKGSQVVVALAEGPRFHRPERFLARHPLDVECHVVRCDVGLREERVRAVLALLEQHEHAAVVPVGCADCADAVALGKTRGLDLRLVLGLHGHSRTAIGEAKRNAGHADLAVSVSRHGCDSLIRVAGIPPERVRHIPFGVVAGDVRARDGDGGKMLRVAYVGRLDQEEKRVLDLIGIMQRLEGWPVRLDVVGEGGERGRLQQAMADEVESGRVVFRGYVDSAHLADEVYADADALLILSASEGGPITAWEAMAHGVVPVTSDFEGRSTEPVWRPTENCLVFPVGDVAAAAQQLKMLADPAVRLPMSAAARDLPPEYRRAAFVEGWRRATTDSLFLPARGAGLVREAPSSPGRLRRFPIVRRGLRRLRGVLGRSGAPADPGAEWPGAYPPDPRPRAGQR